MYLLEAPMRVTKENMEVYIDIIQVSQGSIMNQICEDL